MNWRIPYALACIHSAVGGYLATAPYGRWPSIFALVIVWGGYALYLRDALKVYRGEWPWNREGPL